MCRMDDWTCHMVPLPSGHIFSFFTQILFVRSNICTFIAHGPWLVVWQEMLRA